MSLAEAGRDEDFIAFRSDLGPVGRPGISLGENVCKEPMNHVQHEAWHGQTAARSL